MWRVDIYDSFIFGSLFNGSVHCIVLYVFQVSDIYAFLKKRWLHFTVVSSQYLCVCWRLSAYVGKSAVNKAAFYLSVHNSWAFLLQKRFSFIFLLVAIATNYQSNLLFSSMIQWGLPLYMKHETLLEFGGGKGNVIVFSICRFWRKYWDYTMNSNSRTVLWYCMNMKTRIKFFNIS